MNPATTTSVFAIYFLLFKRPPGVAYLKKNINIIYAGASVQASPANFKKRLLKIFRIRNQHAFFPDFS